MADDDLWEGRCGREQATGQPCPDHPHADDRQEQGAVLLYEVVRTWAARPARELPDWADLADDERDAFRQTARSIGGGDRA